MRGRERERERERETPVTSFDITLKSRVIMHMIRPIQKKSLFPVAKGGAVANRLRRRTSDQTVLGSNPAVAAALSAWTRLFTPIVPRRSLHISFY